MKTLHPLSQAMLAMGLLMLPVGAHAYDSGSTGADGAFNPTQDTEVQLPPNGVFNFISVNIPNGVTVRFKKNASNTPVVMLASGDVSIAGTIDLNGTNSANSGTAGDGNLGDDGRPGLGGPGAGDGGRGGVPGVNGGTGGAGQGPGGGGGGVVLTYCGNMTSGGGAGYSANGIGGAATLCGNSYGGPAGSTYGAPQILPLVGGSGGGGGSAGSWYAGAGGGGGGGAILIAVSGAVSLTGAILANAGNTGVTAGSSAGTAGGRGGGGSGGAIRIVATSFTGEGVLSAQGAAQPWGDTYGGSGSHGRIRIEAENYQRAASSTPILSFVDMPGPAFLPGVPALRITSVAGIQVPDQPTGKSDVVLPGNTSNPVTVTFAATGVPVGSTVKLTLIPQYGAIVTATSSALAGSTASATASVSVNLPAGPSVLEATTTYTLTLAMGETLSRFAQGERVEKVTLVAAPGQASKVVLVTVTGKEFEAPQAALALLQG
jgi:hypothetical protein